MAQQCKDTCYSKSVIMQDFPGDSVVKTVLPVHRAQFQSLVRELVSHMPQGAAKKHK